MAQLYDEADASETIASGADGTPLTVKTGGSARAVSVLINDDAGSAPADYTLVTEVYDVDADTWYQKDTTSTTGSTAPTYVSHDAIPEQMRFTLTNDDASQQPFHMRVIAHR